MRRKKILVSLLAGSMALGMAVPTMAANVKDVKTNGAAYQNGLVTMTSAPSSGLADAYNTVDSILESAAAKFDQNTTTAAAIQNAFNSALADGLKNKSGVTAEVTSVNINRTPSGNTVSTSGDATVGVRINGTAFSLDVKWGTDVADALKEAEQLVATSAQTSDGAIYKVLTNASNYLSSNETLDANKLKELKLTAPALTTNKTYNVSAQVTNASDYAAPTATTAGSYKVTIKTIVTGNGSDVDSSVSASREVTYTISLARKAVVQSVALKNNINPTEIGKAYDIDVTINGNASASASDIASYGFSFGVSDTSVAHLIDSSTSNTGKAIVFDKFGTVGLTATTPYGHDTSTTDMTKTKNTTYTLADHVVLTKNKTNVLTYLDGLDKTVAQVDVSSADTAASAAKKLIQDKLDAVYGSTKAAVTISDVISFVPATAGTASSASGTNGSFLANATVTDSDASVGTISKQYRFTIKATAYKTFSDVTSGKGDLADAVDYGVAKGFISGYNDGTFRPNATVTRAQFVAFLYRLSGATPVAASAKFTDTSNLSGADFTDAINWASANNIVAGYPDGTFRPNETVTRAQAAAFLHRYYKGSTTTTVSTTFTDVKAGAWYADDVAWGVSKGIIAGYNPTTFGTSDSTTRGQAVQFIYRAEKANN